MNAIFCPTGLSKHMLGQPHKCNASYNLGSCLLNKYPYFIGLLMWSLQIIVTMIDILGLNIYLVIL